MTTDDVEFTMEYDGETFACLARLEYPEPGAGIFGGWYTIRATSSTGVELTREDVQEFVSAEALSAMDEAAAAVAEQRSEAEREQQVNDQEDER